MIEYLWKPRYESIWGSQDMRVSGEANIMREYLGKPRDERVYGEAKR